MGVEFYKIVSHVILLRMYEIPENWRRCGRKFSYRRKSDNTDESAMRLCILTVGLKNVILKSGALHSFSAPFAVFCTHLLQ